MISRAQLKFVIQSALFGAAAGAFAPIVFSAHKPISYARITSVLIGLEEE